jgi:hypothetical protein
LPEARKQISAWVSASGKGLLEVHKQKTSGAMATRSVPGKFATIQAAVNGAQPGDVIAVATGYPPNELVSVPVNNLTFTIPADVLGIVLFAGAGVQNITLANSSPVQIIGNGLNNNFVGNAGANIISDGGGGDDTLNGGGGNDTLWVTEASTT